MHGLAACAPRSSAHHGHYYAVARQSDAALALLRDRAAGVAPETVCQGGSWFLFNDEHVSACDWATLRRIPAAFATDTAYICLYRRATATDVAGLPAAVPLPGPEDVPAALKVRVETDNIQARQARLVRPAADARRAAPWPRATGPAPDGEPEYVDPDM
jgi:hypothetical protein